LAELLIKSLPKMASNLLAIVMVFLFAGCHSQNNESSKQAGKDIQAKYVPNDWIKDKCGCLKLRNEKLAYKLIHENNLTKGTKDDFLKVFGAANKIDNANNKEVLIYYFDCVCVNNNLKDNGDKCYASFYFEKNKLKAESFICE